MPCGEKSIDISTLLNSTSPSSERICATHCGIVYAPLWLHPLYSTFKVEYCTGEGQRRREGVTPQNPQPRLRQVGGRAHVPRTCALTARRHHEGGRQTRVVCVEA